VIYIRMELWPYGDRSMAKVIGEGVIANDGQGTSTSGNYNSWFKNGEFEDPTRPSKAWKTAHLDGFPRKRMFGWDLVKKLLDVALRDR
jgi:hypothetical protein